MAIEKKFYALGTENTIWASGKNADRSVDAAIRRVLEIEEKMSAFRPESEICRLAKNAGIQSMAVSGDVFDVLSQALRMSKMSGGAFDITVRPLTKLWNFGSGAGVVPAPEDVEKAKRLTGYKNIRLDEKKKTAYIKKKDVCIDLGGIAKGYAADETRRILDENGVADALINLGGNIVCMGVNPEGKPWKIGIQNPFSNRGDFVAAFDVCGKSVVTSAINERFFIKDGIRYHHILDPRTGFPAHSGLASVSVIGENSMVCDMLSTAVFVLGQEAGLPLIKAFGAEAVFITENGDILSTFQI